MKLSEIAEYIIKEDPGCCMAHNKTVIQGNREDWYEEYLIDYLLDYFTYEVMDMCGCGVPELTHELIRRVLSIRNERLPYEETLKKYKQELHLDTDDDTQYGSLQFILYILNSRGILEHGSSVGGSWLTNLGRMYLAVLNAWHDRENKE